MSAETPVIYDSFAAAMERLRASLPDHFAFEIDAAFFENLESFSEARHKQTLMRGFVAEAKLMGYKVEIGYAQSRFDKGKKDYSRYSYDLQREKPAAPTDPKPIEEGAIDV